MTRKPRLTLTLPNSLRKAAKDFAPKDGVSVNQYIALALAEKIEARGAAEFFEARGRNGDPAWVIAFLEARPE